MLNIPYTTIIATNDGRLFAVAPYASGDHNAVGIRVKHTRNGYEPTAGAREQVVRIAASRVVFAPDKASSQDQSGAARCS